MNPFKRVGLFSGGVGLRNAYETSSLAARCTRMIVGIGVAAAVTAGATGMATPASAQTPTTESCANADDVDILSEEYLSSVEVDGTEIFEYTCTDPEVTINGASVATCWRGEAWKVWLGAANNDLQRLETTTSWCDDANNNATRPTLDRVYGNGYWGWTYTGEAERNTWTEGYYSYAEVAGAFEACLPILGCEHVTRWLKVRHGADGEIDVVD